MLARTAVASGAPAWNPAADLSPASADSEGPDVAVDGHGNAVAVWLQSATGSNHQVMASDHPAGGVWSLPVSLAPASANAGTPVVALDAAGDAFAAWAQGPDGTHIQIHTASRPHGGSWQASPDLLGDPALPSGFTRLAVNSSGDEVLAWSTQDSTFTSSTPWATYRPAGGSWLTPQRLSGSATQPEVSGLAAAIDPQGAATVVWAFRDTAVAGSHPAIQASRHVPGTVFPWSFFPATLSNTADFAYEPAVAAAGNGAVTAVWADNDGTGPQPQRILGSDFSTALGSWTPHPVVPSISGTVVGEPALVFDAAGDATAAWFSAAATGDAWIESSTRPAGGSWPATATKVSNDITNAASVAISGAPDGSTAVGWDEKPAGSAGYLPSAAVREGANGAWSAPHAASSSGENAALAIDQQGNTIIAWDEAIGPHRLVRDATFSAPTLGAVAIPATGVAGVPVHFSVSPFDVWSPTMTSWTFGDGAQSTGSAATHTYGSPGRRTVTVRTANLGNASASTAMTITISAPGGSGPPVLTRVSQSHSVWARAHRLARLAAARRPPVGTKFALTLNEAATLRFAFTRLVTGRSVGRRCVTPTRTNRRSRACTIARAAGALSIGGHRGADTLAFYGQLSRTRRLGTGRFRLTITAAANGRTSNAAILRFTIVR